MIPLILRLHDFMSYATLDLDLRGLHAAVLCGPNGSGKSSLLDAITFALWEKARSGPEQLIRLGADEMWVELVFGLDGQTYRVWRRRTRKGGGHGQLEFHQLVDADGEAFVPLTGNTSRETQAKILATVKMDYETFVSSAFILQGRADAFTTRTPRERKALLADILGLQAYDDLSRRARDKWKAAQARADALESDQADLRALLAGRGAIEAAHAASQATLAELARRVESVRAREAALVAEREGLAGAGARLAELEALAARAGGDAERLAREIERHDEALSGAGALRASRAPTEANFHAWEAARDQEAAMRQLAAAHAGLERERQQRERDRETARHEGELALRGLDDEWAALERERLAALALVRDEPRIEASFRLLARTRAAEADHMARGLAARGLETRLAVIQGDRQARNLAHAARQAAARERRCRLAADAAALAAVRAAYAEAAAEVERLAVLAVERDRVKENGFAHKARWAAADEAARQAEAAACSQDRRAAQYLPGAETGPGHHPLACPTCAGPLADDGALRVASHFEALARNLEDEAVRARHEAEAAERELLASRARYALLSRELAGHEAAQRRLGELAARLEALAAVEAELAALDAELASPPAPDVSEEQAAEEARLEAELAALAFEPAELPILQARLAENRWSEARHWQLEQAQAALARLEGRRPGLEEARAAARAAASAAEREADDAIRALDEAIAAVGYDAAAHAALAERLEGLAGAPAAKADLDLALSRLAGTEALVARLEAERERALASAAEATRDARALAGSRERLAALALALAEAAAEAGRLRDNEGARHAALGRLEGELSRLDEAALALERQGERRERALEDGRLYQALAEAFGKNGIQALMIENAIPELEEDANRLLARLSDNRMHVRLVTQREKKAGGTQETLDIFISDELGTRPYELFSGGEAFRVNFALRLALSKMLARRAGAALQTLVIDEGFGTQDERGRERLIDAIHAVSADFSLILVITHIRELKEAFSTQIEVVKRGGTSHVALVA